MAVVVVLLLIVGLGWALFTQVVARQQVNVSCPGDEASTRTQLQAMFGPTWKQVQGPGVFNAKPRMRLNAPTLSVNIRANGQGCDASIWTSDYTTKYGLMWHSQLMWRKKRRVAAHLTAGTIESALDEPPQ